jgi:hypothetical protein
MGHLLRMSHSTSINQSINQSIKIIMKNSLLILGIALVSFTNVCNAKNIDNKSALQFPSGIFADDKGVISSEGKGIIAKPTVNTDVEVFSPETVIPFTSKTVYETIAEGDKIIESEAPSDLEFMVYEESMKEIIAQSELIIESSVSNETYPLFNERTIEDKISELEKVIESKETNEVRPLDFKKINGDPEMPTLFNSKRFIGMK